MIEEIRKACEIAEGAFEGKLRFRLAESLKGCPEFVTIEEAFGGIQAEVHVTYIAMHCRPPVNAELSDEMYMARALEGAGRCLLAIAAQRREAGGS